MSVLWKKLIFSIFSFLNFLEFFSHGNTHSYIVVLGRRRNKLASLEATLVRNYDPLNHLLTGVKCRATSVAKNFIVLIGDCWPKHCLTTSPTTVLHWILIFDSRWNEKSGMEKINGYSAAGRIAPLGMYWIKWTSHLCSDRFTPSGLLSGQWSHHSSKIQ